MATVFGSSANRVSYAETEAPMKTAVLAYFSTAPNQYRYSLTLRDLVSFNSTCGK
jgi:hypothetical protein